MANATETKHREPYGHYRVAKGTDKKEMKPPNLFFFVVANQRNAKELFSSKLLHFRCELFTEVRPPIPCQDENGPFELQFRAVEKFTGQCFDSVVRSEACVENVHQVLKDDDDALEDIESFNERGSFTVRFEKTVSKDNSTSGWSINAILWKPPTKKRAFAGRTLRPNKTQRVDDA